MTVVYVPTEHRCEFVGQRIGGGWYYPAEITVRRFPVGTVRQCDACGQTWVAGEAVGIMSSVWRREGRVERWRRERR